jgi:hypothetical protein
MLFDLRKYLKEGSPGPVIQLTLEEIMHIIQMTIVEHEKSGRGQEKEWISAAEAMGLLGISSKTTLQKFRDEGQIEFTVVTSKTFLYRKESILAYLERKARKSFYD